MNKRYIAIRDIPRRGHIYRPGDEVEIAHHLPNWRKNQLQAGNLRIAPAIEPVAMKDMKVTEVATYVEDIDNVERLRLMVIEEQDGKGRPRAIDAVLARIDLLDPDHTSGSGSIDGEADD